MAVSEHKNVDVTEFKKELKQSQEKYNELEVENKHLKHKIDTLDNLVTGYATKSKETESKLTHKFKQKEEEYIENLAIRTRDIMTSKRRHQIQIIII